MYVSYLFDLGAKAERIEEPGEVKKIRGGFKGEEDLDFAWLSQPIFECLDLEKSV